MRREENHVSAYEFEAIQAYEFEAIRLEAKQQNQNSQNK